MPQDDVYLPLHVGRSGKPDLGYVGDDSGDNISDKNSSFCELTGLYWAWKNLSADYLGLCHYRRYFGSKNFFDGVELVKQKVFRRADYERLLDGVDVLLPTRRNYYVETVRSQYEHAHSPRDLDRIEHIISCLYPDNLRSFRAVMSRRRLHLWNMFVMKRQLVEEYCRWLFDILFEFERWMDKNAQPNEKLRLFGFVSERLLDVWLFDKNLKTVETDVVMLEKVNWLKKGSDFIKRKLFGGRG
ncbi:MAG: DUF4422 domain-containing protein [Selenomonadaceae bacterium]|nr:DUF4422 domain-containing protein [Selenomonadaceae bacterium]MBR1579719.1 DUF4422 domain-containing protein [Selenomonadaceae bacterium]